MKKILIFLAAFICFSCSEETGEQPARGDKTLLLELNVSGNNAYPTKAGEYEEEHIEEIDIILFKKDGSTDKYYSHRSIPNNEITDVGNKKEFSITLDEELANAGARIMLLANSRSILNDFFNENQISNTTERSFFHEKLIYKGYGWAGNEAITYTYPPMCGIHSAYVYNNRNNQVEKISMHLFRVFARIDIGIDMRNTESEIRDKLTIKRVGVYGTNTWGCIPRNFTEPLYDLKTKKTNLPSSNKRVMDDRHWYSYVMNGDNIMEQVIYVPETAAFNTLNSYEYTKISQDGQETTHKVFDPKNPPYNGTFLILETDYNGESDRYYRVDFNDGYDYIDLIRNNRYEINITQVANRGYDTPEAAMLSVPITRSSKSDTGQGLIFDIKIDNTY